MSRKVRVGIIGRTGKGNYGHSLDIVWKQFPETKSLPSPTKIRLAEPRQKPRLVLRAVTRITRTCWRRKSWTW